LCDTWQAPIQPPLATTRVGVLLGVHSLLRPLPHAIAAARGRTKITGSGGRYRGVTRSRGGSQRDHMATVGRGTPFMAWVRCRGAFRCSRPRTAERFVSTFPLISLSRNDGSYRAEAPQQIPEVHGGAPTWRTRMHTALRLGVLNSLPFGTPCCCPRALCRQQIFRHACTVDWYVLQQIAPPQPTQSPLSVRVRAAIEAVPFESPQALRHGSAARGLKFNS
jgi:hypothetical protein